MTSLQAQGTSDPSVYAAVLALLDRCLERVPGAPPQGAPASADSLKLFRWLLEFVVHPNPKVRARGQAACTSALEQSPGLSGAAARFVEARLAAAALKDVQ